MYGYNAGQPMAIPIYTVLPYCVIIIFAFVTDSGLQIEGIINIPDQCQMSTCTDPGIDHQEVEHYIHDLLER